MLQEDNFQFWEDIYLDNDAGWDLGGVTPVFESIAQEMNKGKLCIVGCGCGYDVIMFAKQGFDVTAVDFAPFPIQAIRRMALESSLNINILQADIFSYILRTPRKVRRLLLEQLTRSMAHRLETAPFLLKQYIAPIIRTLGRRIPLV